MRGIPEPYAAPPAGVSALGFLVWICRRQWRSIVAGSFYDVVWLLGLALTPWAVGRVIDEGIVAQDAAAFALWISVVVWLQLQHSLIQGLRDRAGILNWRRGFGRVYQVVSRTTARNATAQERRLSPGAAATMATNDAFSIGFLPIMIGALAASVVSYVVVGVILLRDSPLLGGLVLVGVPVFSGLLFVLVKPLRERQSDARTAAERMNEVAGDTIRGLRVLRGIGGERAFLERYRRRSAAAREAGIRVAWPVAGVEAIKLAVGGVLLVGLTWIGAALVAADSLTVGELVAFYGYAGFMVLPVTLVAHAVTTGVQAEVGARKIVGLLAARPLVADAPDVIPLPPSSEPRGLSDDRSGIDVPPGALVGIVPGAPADAGAIADRFARLSPDDDMAPSVHVGGRDAATVPLTDLRREVVVADTVPFLFSGTLRSLLDPDGRHSDDEIRAALEAAAASDIVESAPDGLASDVGERAREFSGGQRQRLGVARALLRAEGALVLLDPTSSVDAVTEGRMSAGIRAHRAARTTLVASASPLVLAGADRVDILADGEVTASGTHALLLRDARYRERVLREEGEA